MKLQFDPNQDYQLQAINAVCDIFRGQEICRSEFTVTNDAAKTQMQLQFAENNLGPWLRILPFLGKKRYPICGLKLM